VHDYIAAHHHTGYFALALIVGLENMGLPLPGESLLIGAAIYAGTTHRLNIALVVLSVAAGSFVGNACGYLIGGAIGFTLLRRYGRYIGLSEQRLALGRELFRRHGGKVVIFGRFVVVLRTLAALLAGANQMPWPRFFLANAAGSIAWSGLYGFGAYLLGDQAKKLAGPAGIAIGIVGAIALVATIVFVRRQEKRLIAEAQAHRG
jgi:membrane protein DedA with SNARE-associated domain